MPACSLAMASSRADSLLRHAQSEFSAVRDHYMRAGQGFLIVYSVTSPSSFHEVSQFRDQILRVRGADSAPIVIVANKARAPPCPAL
jgi:GTPase KRas protein